MPEQSPSAEASRAACGAMHPIAMALTARAFDTRSSLPIFGRIGRICGSDSAMGPDQHALPAALALAAGRPAADP